MSIHTSLTGGDNTMKKEIRYSKLCEDVEQFLISLNYSEGAIRAHKRHLKKLGEFLERKGIANYNVVDGLEYLHETIDYPDVLKTSPLSGENRAIIRAIRVLNEYAESGSIPTGIKAGTTDWNEEVQIVFEAYRRYCETIFKTRSTIKVRLTAAKHFINNAVYLRDKRFSDLTEKDISKYISCYKGMTKQSIENYLRGVKVFLKYLHDNNYNDRDLSVAIPRLKYAQSERIPHWLTADEVNKLLSSIDRGSPLGKRDYAVIIMAATLGMRDSDIVDLTFHCLDWEHNKISFVQRKTGKSVVLPLLPVVGEAIIDYLKHGRPASDCPNVFLRHRAPFKKMSSFYMVMCERMKIAGLSTNPEQTRGLHVLRHTLATDLLKQGESYSTISTILGHSNLGSTNSYAHVDLDGLMKCALDLQEVIDYVQ